MHSRSLVVFGLALLVAVRVLADETWTGTSDVKFHGTSTLHDFDGTIPKVPLKVTVKPGADGRLVSAMSDVEVAKMNTAEPKRDKSMWEMFQQAKYRFIKIEVNEVPEKVLKPSGTKAGSMPVVLNIAGQRGKVVGAVTNVVEAPATTSFDLKFPVSLKAFSLEPPKAVGGLVKVGDTVQVEAHVTLKKAGTK